MKVATRKELQDTTTLFAEYVAALLRLRRHRRMMRETKCDIARENEGGMPCWVESDALDMCDKCLMRQVAYHFRKEALKEVARLRRKLIRWGSDAEARRWRS